MTQLIQALFAGLGNGAVIALIALGFVIIYKSSKVISFAQPSLMIVGAVTVSYLSVSYGLPFLAAVPIAMVLTAALALVIERLALRPMIGKPVFVVAIITIGVDIGLRVVMNEFIGATIRQVGDPWGLSVLTFGSVVLQQRYIAMLVVTLLAVAALVVFFRRSRQGLAMRAAALDQETTLAQGVSVGTVFALSWGIAGALAALGGAFVGTGSGITQTTWTIALVALPAIVIGGLDSLPGAVIGGLVVGLVQALVATYQPTTAEFLGQGFDVVSPYVLLLLVLLVRPYGLFGTPEVERV